MSMGELFLDLWLLLWFSRRAQPLPDALETENSVRGPVT